MHAFAIVRTYIRLGFLNFMQYRSDFFVGVLNALISFATQLLAISVVFNQTSDLRGWSREDLVVLVGVHALVSGVLGLVISPSINAFMTSIREGTFDFLLTKPTDAQLLASVQSVAPQALTSLVAGVVLVVVGLSSGAGAPGPLDIAAFGLMLIAGVCMVYSFMMLLASMSFWFVKLDNIMNIFNTMFGTAGNWPITIFPGWMRVMLTFIIPIAFAVTVPAQALTGSLTIGTAIAAIGVAAMFMVGSRLFWRFAIRHYTGASA